MRPGVSRKVTVPFVRRHDYTGPGSGYGRATWQKMRDTKLMVPAAWASSCSILTARSISSAVRASIRGAEVPLLAGPRPETGDTS